MEWNRIEAMELDEIEVDRTESSELKGNWGKWNLM